MGARATGPGIVLIGPRRCGKTTVGTVLATRLRRAFVDTDRLIRAMSGRDPARVIVEDGEEALRALEREAVAGACRIEGAVIATGGGTPLDPGSRARLAAHGIVIYLEVSIEELLARLAGDPRPESRPSLTGRSPEEEVRHLLRVREPVYREAADRVVAADDAVPLVVERCHAAVDGLRPDGPV